MKNSLFACVLAGLTAAGSLQQSGFGSFSQASGPSDRLAASMRQKLDHIQQNARRQPPDQTPTILSEEEINHYFASGAISLPPGVKRVRLEGHSGSVIAFLKVDFDQIRAGQGSANPLLALFTGIHDVELNTTAAGNGGKGRVHVQDMSIDGVAVPHLALQYFADKYISSRYPNLGMDSEFQMPDRVDMAIVGYHKLIVTQK